MGNLEIIQRNGNKIPLFSREPFCALKSAVQNTSLMGDDSIQLSFISDTAFTFGKGDKIVIDGEEYTLRTKVKREMYSESHFVYDATFYGVMYELMKCIYRDTDEQGKSSRSTFDLTYTICDFVRVIVYNMNRDYPGLWQFNEKDCPVTEARTISFSRNNCLQVLQTLCSESEFNLEFLITQDAGVRTIHIGKFGSKIVPPGGSNYFEWGKGKGLYSLKEEKVDDKAIITRLWVEGGTNNIRSNYRNYSERLQLPFPKRKNTREHTLWDGKVIPANSEMIGIDDDAKRYLEDAALKAALGSEEDAVVYDEIYPKRTGKVTALVDGDINSFIDETMDFDLCEKDSNGTKYLINDVTAKITFISGKLAGQQFEISQKGGYDHATKRFKLIPFTDSRGLTIPTTENDAYRLRVGDMYKITDINLPESYERDAEEDLWYAGLNEFVPRTQARAQYGLSFDRSYFIENLPSDSRTTIFRVGDYVPVKDVRFGLEKNIRIQKIRRNLLNMHDYELTLSDIVAVSIISQTVVEVERIESVIEGNNLKDFTKARRGWRTTEELRNMVYDTDGYFDPENIKPNSIDTNMLTVGSKSQQFVLVGVVLEANKGGNPNIFAMSAGTLAHLTIDEDKVRHWSIPGASYTMSEAGGYYVFAKCSKSGDNGGWYITQEQLKVEPVSDPNNFYFQVGIIGSLHPDDNFRDFTTTYGFTRINGNTITTGKIVTSDKECYLDLDGNRFRIGDSASSIDWNVTAKRQLTLHNVRLLSDSGDVSYIGVFRGVFNPQYVYYKGDEVTYESGGKICTYRYNNPIPSKGILPTDSTYWVVISQGKDGVDGPYYEVRYAINGSTTSAPSIDPSSLNPQGWSTVQPEVSGGFFLWQTIAKKTADKSSLIEPWSLPIRITPYDGQDGKPGTSVTLADVEYAQSSSNATAPTTGWTTTAPLWEEGKFLWSRTKVTYSDGTETYTQAACITGSMGSSGKDGVGVKSIVEEYYLSSSAIYLQGGSWNTNRPEWKDKWYIWTRSVITYTDGKSITTDAICVTGSKGDKGEPGEKGDKGENPAAVYVGEYSPSKSYIGNRYRLDVVKYNGIYYIARIDAGTFSGIIPTNASMWNPFGAQFESVATSLLLAENANIGGWVFRNNRLESQNGKVYLNGSKGEMRLKGTLQLSTGYSGNFSDVNIFYLPKTSSVRYLDMGQDEEDIGKVCRLYNSNSFGGANYMIKACDFSIEDGNSMSTSEYHVIVRPQETVEMTCFEVSGSPGSKHGRWDVTSRFSQRDFSNTDSKGRYPLLLAVGRISGSSSGVSISGKMFDGRYLSSVITCARDNTGQYRFTFSSGLFPSGYTVMLTGFGSVLEGNTSWCKGTVLYEGSTSFRIGISDDASPNDGSCNIMIFAPEWEYKMS